MSQHLIIFGRIPDMSIPAKTGLGKEIDNEMKARKIGHDCTIKTCNDFSEISPKIQKYFCYGGENCDKKIIEKFKKQFPTYIFFPQHNSAIKDVSGMQDAFEYVHNKQNNNHDKNISDETHKIILIGTDIIGLNTEIVLDCFEALYHFDSCIVPVEDLGYGAIGISKNIDIISEIKNFNSRTHGYNLIQETQELCTKKNISLFIHPQTCFDIDVKEDVMRAKFLL